RHAHLDLLSFPEGADGFGIISKRILSAKFLCDPRKRCLYIVQRIGLKFSASADLGKRFEILPAFFILGRTPAASAPEIYVSALQNRTQYTAPTRISSSSTAAAAPVSVPATAAHTHVPGGIIPNGIKQRIRFFRLIDRALV